MARKFETMGQVTVASDRDAWSVQDDGAEVIRRSTLAEAVELAHLLVAATKAAGGRSSFIARSEDQGDVRRRSDPPDFRPSAAGRSPR